MQSKLSANTAVQIPGRRGKPSWAARRHLHRWLVKWMHVKRKRTAHRQPLTTTCGPRWCRRFHKLAWAAAGRDLELWRQPYAVRQACVQTEQCTSSMRSATAFQVSIRSPDRVVDAGASRVFRPGGYSGDGRSAGLTAAPWKDVDALLDGRRCCPLTCAILASSHVNPACVQLLHLLNMA